MKHLNLVLPALFLCTAGLAASLEPTGRAAAGSAEDAGATLSVVVEGKVLADPSYLSMKAQVVGNAELAQEAIAEFSQAMARTMTGLEEAGIAGLDVHSAGVEMNYMAEPEGNNNQVFFNGMPQSAPKAGVTCGDEIEIRFQASGTPEEQRTQVAAAIDLALDLELQMGPRIKVNPYVYNSRDADKDTGTVLGQFSDDAEAAAVLAAQTDAMQRARVQAEQLASLSGRDLGLVTSVSQSSMKQRYKGIAAGIEVTTELRVTFELK